jgi:ABC-type antimicrobial peptide transport system permease subunit
MQSIDPSVPLIEPQRMTVLLADSVAQPRFRSALLASFAGLAVLLAVVGIYGVVAFGVEQRTHEIGLRVALGAPRAAVMGLVLRQGAVPVAVGVAVGLVGAFAVGRAMKELLFNIEPGDPVTFIGMPLLLAAAAFVACLVPARRALAVDPAKALRSE